MNSCYVYKKKQKTCLKCGDGLMLQEYPINKKDGKTVKYQIKICRGCGKWHISYAQYSSFILHEQINCLNKDILEQYGRIETSKKSTKKNKKLNGAYIVDTAKRYSSGKNVNASKCVAVSKYDFSTGKKKKHHEIKETDVKNTYSVQKPVANNIVSAKAVATAKAVASDIHDVYVYFNLQTCSCVRDKHDVSSVTLLPDSMDGKKKIQVNAYHCKKCQRYFINHEAVKKLISKDMYPMLNFQIVNDTMSNLKPESKLGMYGYNVKVDGMSENQRRVLLSTLIEKKLMSKQEILACIQFNLRFQGKRSNMEYANGEWKKDIDFVSTYIKDNKSIIGGKLVR